MQRKNGQDDGDMPEENAEESAPKRPRLDPRLAELRPYRGGPPRNPDGTLIEELEPENGNGRSGQAVKRVNKKGRRKKKWTGKASQSIPSSFRFGPPIQS